MLKHLLMQPESKLYSIPDFNPLPMKPIQLLTLVFFSVVISSYSYAQNLQFNSAVFYEYGGGQATGDQYHNIVITDVLTVGANQVLKITSIGGSVGLPDSFSPYVEVTINEKAINYFYSGGRAPIEVYLPAGTYNIGVTDSPQAYLGSGGASLIYFSGEVKGFISGILYDIVP